MNHAMSLSIGKSSIPRILLEVPFGRTNLGIDCFLKQRNGEKTYFQGTRRTFFFYFIRIAFYFSFQKKKKLVLMIEVKIEKLNHW